MSNRQRSRISDRRANDAFQRGNLIRDRLADNAVLPEDLADAEALRQQALADNAKALIYFEASLELAVRSNDQSARLKTLTSLIPVYHRAGEITAIQQAYVEAIALLNQLPDSRAKVYATVDLANLYPLTQEGFRERAVKLQN